MKASASVLLALLPLPLVGTTVARADVRVQMHDGLVDLRAAAPLTEVLDALARETGVRVAYVGTRPSTRIVVDVTGGTADDALRQVVLRLERGYGYAVGLTPDRTRIAVLVVTASRAEAAPARDPFEPPPGHGEALEPVPEPWEMEARREAERLAPRTHPPRSAPAVVAAAAPADPPIETYGPDPFEPPPERGNRLEPVAARRVTR